MTKCLMEPDDSQGMNFLSSDFGQCICFYMFRNTGGLMGRCVINTYLWCPQSHALSQLHIHRVLHPTHQSWLFHCGNHIVNPLCIAQLSIATCTGESSSFIQHVAQPTEHLVYSLVYTIDSWDPSSIPWLPIRVALPSNCQQYTK
jgi:hypothetical protein